MKAPAKIFAFLLALWTLPPLLAQALRVLNSPTASASYRGRGLGHAGGQL
jgi:hypothetical protein